MYPIYCGTGLAPIFSGPAPLSFFAETSSERRSQDGGEERSIAGPHNAQPHTSFQSCLDRIWPVGFERPVCFGWSSAWKKAATQKAVSAQKQEEEMVDTLR